MRKELTYILISILTLNSFSCKNEKKKKSLSLKTEMELRMDSIESFNESKKTVKIEAYSITEDNSEKRELKKIKQPKKTTFRNLEIDTTKLFGLWSQDPTGPFADFNISSKSFNVLDFDGEGENPYILDKNKITVFYKNLVHNGIITSTDNDTLKIKWNVNGIETEYVKF